MVISLKPQRLDCEAPVASFTKEVNLWLAKCPLVFNGSLTNRWLTSLVKEATAGYSMVTGNTSNSHLHFWHTDTVSGLYDCWVQLWINDSVCFNYCCHEVWITRELMKRLVANTQNSNTPKWGGGGGWRGVGSVRSSWTYWVSNLVISTVPADALAPIITQVHKI